jgi:hypothetical protein
MKEVFVRRCPYCHGWIHKKATRCKHCKASLENNDNQIISYINNGFNLIEKEITEFENEIHMMSRGYFRRHEYTEEELMHSRHIDKIKSVAGKIGSDLENWRVMGKVNPGVSRYYEEKVDLLRQKTMHIIEMIKTRRKTAWDLLKDILLSSITSFSI